MNERNFLTKVIQARHGPLEPPAYRTAEPGDSQYPVDARTWEGSWVKVTGGGQGIPDVREEKMTRY